MEVYEILLPLALILILSKLMGMGAQKIGLPAIIGMLLAGILIGLVQYIPGVEEGTFIYDAFFSDEMLEGYSFLAKIGVVLIMFSAGITTDLRQIRSTGLSAVVITVLGVAVPMLFGFLVAYLFDYYTVIDLINGGETGVAGEVDILSDVFYGAILTATSVSVTVAALKELGRLNTRFGTAIIAAAVIDDIIGVVVLSVLTGLNSSNGTAGGILGSWFEPGPLFVCIKIVIFFAAALGIGFFVRKLFRWMEDTYPHHRRVPIFAVAMSFLYAYLAEKLFGVADITGAYVAGLVLSGLDETYYEEQKINSLGYMLFTPVFFANIGISSLNLSAFGGLWLAFGACYILAAFAGKLVGCGGGGLLCRYSLSDSLKIGLGMMVRAEVILVCAQKGIDSGLVSTDVLSYVCLIIILSSILVPVFLKVICRHDAKKERHISGQI